MLTSVSRSLGLSVKIDVKATSPQRSLRMRGWLEDTTTEGKETGQQWGRPAIPEFSFRPCGISRRQPSSSHLENIPVEKVTQQVKETPGMCLCSGKGGRVREVNQRKPHLSKTIIVQTSPRGFPKEPTNPPGKDWAMCHKEG